METRPFGEWPSPISGALVGAGVLRLQQPLVNNNTVYWIEGRPAEKGRCVLVCATPNGAQQDLTPAPYSVKTRAQEYGGGAFAVHGDTVWFINAADQCIYTLRNEATNRLTAPSDYRFADLQVDANRNRLVAVCEDHGVAGEPRSSLVAIDTDSGEPTELHGGHDLYSTPRLSPDGHHLAWLAWNHPQMPWTATQLWQARITTDGKLADATCIAGAENNESIVQPEYAPDGSLHFVSDKTDGWWAIYRFDNKGLTKVTHQPVEFAAPRWSFGMRHYGFLADGTLVAAFTHNGLWHVCRIAPDGQQQTLDLPYTHIDHLHAAGDTVALLAGAPDHPLSVVRLKNNHVNTLARAVDLPLDNAYLPAPQAVQFATGNNETAHGLYYAPANPDYCAPAGTTPPLLVKCHGGPTGATGSALDLKIRFWTSRGFAVLDVNYRGSTGYGRAYREALHGQWGIADVDDCLAGARYLAEQGLADPTRLLISGSSAGGFTVLAALTFHKLFRAGASYYGVADLESCMRDTHKFEARYSDTLLGPWPEAAAIYHARSPLQHAEQLNCPVIFFQGEDDAIVPPQQSQRMHAALKAAGQPTALLQFAGEAHGFRQSHTIEQCLNAELAFYGKVLGFSPAGNPDLPPIANAGAARE
ncbi:MAG TPA: S9 family peptidase [Gammaproteobacteria bacterium]|nr:S9 family peptidase [Gammaproteobacteria bacterium]